MYFLDVDTAVESLHDFWTTCADGMPDVVKIIVDPHGDIINDENGEIVDAWAATPQSEISGAAAQPFAAPAGLHVGWETDTILDGRRLRGRTFIVPLAVTNYQDDGTLNPGTITGFGAAAAQLVIEQAESFVVWHRPYEGRAATEDLPAKPAHDGGHGLITSHRVGDKVSVLTSRRA